MSAFPMREVYEMDGITVHRHSPVYPQTYQTTGHSSLQPGMQTADMQWQPGIQVSPSAYDPRLLSAAPSAVHHMYPSPQSSQPQAVYSCHQQPVIVMDTTSAPLFQERLIKMDYIRKVLGVLFTQIGVCFLILNVFSLRPIKDWTQHNMWFPGSVSAAACVTLFLLTMFANSHQDCPANCLLTGLFTLFASLAIGSSSVFGLLELLSLTYFFDVTLIISFSLIFSLILYAFQTSYDFNCFNCMTYVVLIVVVFIVIYLLLIVVWSSWLALFLPTVAFATFFGLSFTLYVIADLTWMIRRSLMNSLTPDSVLLALIYLHTDFFTRNGNFWGPC